MMRRTRDGSRNGPTLGVGSCLLLLLLIRPPVLERPAVYPDQFPLFPTFGNEGASGAVYLKQPWSPFGISVDEAGRVQYDVTVEVSGLPVVDGETYHAWLTESSLETIVHLGPVEAAHPATGRSDWHQLMVIVSREPDGRPIAPGERWSGPIILRGFSAGARVQPLGSHSIFQPAPM